MSHAFDQGAQMCACPAAPSCALPIDKTLLAANVATTMATTAANKMMRFTMPPSFILASLLALRLLIGSRPLVFPSFYKLPRYKFPRTLRYLINNTAEWGAQDEPFLRSTTLTLCLKVRANLPYFALYTQGSVLRKRTPDI